MRHWIHDLSQRPPSDLDPRLADPPSRLTIMALALERDLAEDWLAGGLPHAFVLVNDTDVEVMLVDAVGRHVEYAAAWFEFFVEGWSAQMDANYRLYRLARH